MTKYVAPFDASERVLSDGRPITPGEPIELKSEDLKDEHNKRLIEEGQLIKATEAKEAQQ
jgi:hypothetical protein